MNKWVLVIPLMMCVCVTYAQIFKWTDSNGVVHFSDRPHDGAKVIKMPAVQTYSPPVVPVLNNASSEVKIGKKAEEKYTSLALTQPLNESTIRNNKGYLVVASLLKPALAAGDLYQLLFDGAPIGDLQPTPTFQLNGIYRGSHTVAVQVVNAAGDVLIVSDSVTFFMHRPFVGMGKNQ